MKYLKNLSLAAIAAGVLMAFVGAGTASATELTCTRPAGTRAMCQTGETLFAESEGHVIFDSIPGTIECRSTMEVEQTNTGGANETVAGAFRTLTFTGCTNGALVTVLRKGTVEIHTDASDPEGVSGNGTLTSTGAEVTVEVLGFHCIFETKATDIGTLTGATTAINSKSEPTHMATLDINARITWRGGRTGAFCGESATWTGSYTVTSAGSAIGNAGWLDVDHHP